MKTQVRCGVVGCGVIAQNRYIPAIKRYGILEAVCDIREERARRTAEVWKARSYYTDFSCMLENSDVEAVFILTGMGVHGKQVAEAAEAGKHILVQKPLATSLEDLREAVEAVRRAGVKILVEPNVHMNPLYLTAAKILPRIGSPYWFRAGFGRSPPTWGMETFFVKEAGGPLFDLGVYEISILTFLLGPIRRVTSIAKISVPEVELIEEEYLNKHIPEVTSRSVWEIIREAPRTRRIRVEAEDNVMVLAEMERGAIGVIISNYVTPREISRPPRIEIYGSDGYVDVAGGSGYRDPVLVSSFKEGEVFKSEVLEGRRLGLLERGGWFYWDYYEASTRHFLECIAENGDPIPGLEWGAHVAEVMIRALESARTGRTLEVASTFKPYDQVEC